MVYTTVDDQRDMMCFCALHSFFIINKIYAHKSKSQFSHVQYTFDPLETFFLQASQYRKDEWYASLINNFTCLCVHIPKWVTLWASFGEFFSNLTWQFFIFYFWLWQQFSKFTYFLFHNVYHIILRVNNFIILFWSLHSIFQSKRIY